jgi:hypothetical protein
MSSGSATHSRRKWQHTMSNEESGTGSLSPNPVMHTAQDGLPCVLIHLLIPIQADDYARCEGAQFGCNRTGARPDFEDARSLVEAEPLECLPADSGGPAGLLQVALVERLRGVGHHDPAVACGVG